MALDRKDSPPRMTISIADTCVPYHRTPLGQDAEYDQPSHIYNTKHNTHTHT